MLISLKIYYFVLILYPVQLAVGFLKLLSLNTYFINRCFVIFCCILAAACTTKVSQADKAAEDVAMLMCDCAEVKAHLALVERHNNSEIADTALRAQIKTALPASVQAMEKTCIGEFKKAAAAAADKQKFQKVYANQLYKHCPAIAKGLHVKGGS